LYAQRERIVAPLTLDELREHAAAVRKQAGADSIFQDFIAILVSNEAWRSALARIPYDRRLLLLPKCLRAHEHCVASVDEFGMLCKGCGLCSIHELTVEAELLGYAVLVAEGSPIVTRLIETGRIEAVVGVSCMNVLEKCFPHMEAWAVPGLAVPLLQDGCVNTTIDLDWVWELVYTTSEDRTDRLNLDNVRRDVVSWFTAESLAEIMGRPSGETEKIARAWLATAGKRWRPYLTACVYLALQVEHRSSLPVEQRSSLRGSESYSRLPPGADATLQAPPGADATQEPPVIPTDLRKLAVAVECFHKASLIHDDIEDDDAERYCEEALHVRYGVPVALNVGDFLLGEGYRLMGELDVDPRVKVEMLRTAAQGHLTLSRGQGAELCWARDPAPLSSLAVLDILRQKTAPAFEVALRLGAFYGNAEQDVHEVLRRYSESLGIAYQIRDDLEDFAGEGDSNDLRDLRPSLILAIAHKRAAKGAEAELIASLWNRTCDYDDVTEEVQRIIFERGVTDRAEDLLEAYIQQAIRSLRVLKNPTLKGLLRRVVGKIFRERPMGGYCSEFEARNAASGQVGAGPAA
jgi:geranylgeranyl pyrophosphate synthase